MGRVGKQEGREWGPQDFSTGLTLGTRGRMGPLVAISLDEEKQKVPDLGPSTLAKTFPKTLQSCLYVTGLGPTQLSRAGVPVDTFLVSTHFPCLVPINTVGFQTLMDTLWLQVRAAQRCRLPTRLHTNKTFTAQTLCYLLTSQKQLSNSKPQNLGRLEAGHMLLY